MSQAPANPRPEISAPKPGSPEFFAAQIPGAICLVDGQEQLSWQTWNQAADALAWALAQQGIGPNDKVGVRTQICLPWFICNLAIAKLGAMQVALNWRLTPAELRHMLADSGAKALLFDDTDAAALADAVAPLGIEILVAIAPQPPPTGVQAFADLLTTQPPKPYLSRRDAPLVIYTSGTTGRPKGAAPSADKPSQELKEYLADMMGSAPKAANPAPASSADKPRHPPRALLTMPLHHSAGPHAARTCLARGGQVHLLCRFDAEAALRIISEQRITHWSSVPTMLYRISALPAAVRAQYDVSSVRALSVGAAPVSFALKEWAISYFGEGVLSEGYGMTETGMIAGMRPEDQRRKPGSCGKPYRHVQVKIVDAQDQALPAGETGEILVITPTMIKGYLNQGPLGPDKLTADGFFRTGDMGFLDAEGYLYVTDRKTDMIIAGGVNIYPAEIEFTLARHPAIVEAAVIGIPHDEFGEQVMAFCEVRSDMPVTADEILAFCKQELAAYKLPRRIDIVSELPRNPMGKVLKTQLRAPFWQSKEKRI